MNIIVDGIIYQTQSHGGISRLYDEILPRMCDQDQDLRISLLTSGKCKKTPPRHPRIDHQELFPIDELLRPTRLWGRIGLGIRAYLQNSTQLNREGQIWHSTYFTIPHTWKGSIVLTVYDMILERFAKDLFSKPINEAYRKHKRYCIEKADIIICISEATKKDLEEFCNIDSSKTRVIHLAASPVFRQLNGTGDLSRSFSSKPFLLFVGARVAYKNFENLLNAYSSWTNRNDINLVVVGSEWTPREKQRIRELDLEGKVVLLTNVNSDELCILYNRASAFVFPSLYEGFGIPLLEAMACGCPVVASNIPSTVEVAGDCPVYFEPKDKDAIRAALDTVINEGRNSERTKRGFIRAKEFSWDQTAYETLNLYSELTESI
jgi:glycosyltransferase involved in cell wall biosynthesis